jgi:hypothetical protein
MHHAMRFRLLLCLALVVGLAAFALFRKQEGKVLVTYVRTERLKEAWMVFAIRNDTRHPVRFIGFPDEDPNDTLILYKVDDWEVPSQFTTEVSARWDTVNPPRLVHAVVLPSTKAEEESPAQRYSRFPKFIREWLMRKYDPRNPDYRHEVVIPDTG